MSKAVIKRSMIIKSPHHFYELVNSNFLEKIDELNLWEFIYSYENWMNGCPCDEEYNRYDMLAYWDTIKSTPEIVIFLKSYFNCSDVIFED
jgi:hypothetical protein